MYFSTHCRDGCTSCRHSSYSCLSSGYKCKAKRTGAHNFLSKKFGLKNCAWTSVDRLLKKITFTCVIERRKGSNRLRSVPTLEFRTKNRVWGKAHLQSWEYMRVYKTVYEIGRKMDISQLAIWRFAEHNLRLKIYIQAVAYLGFDKGSMASAQSSPCPPDGDLGTEPPAGSRGRAPGQGVRRAKPLKLKHFLFLNIQWKPQIRPFFWNLETQKITDICAV